MDARVEHLFRLREEFQLEVDPLVKRALHRKLLAEVKAFLNANGLHLSAHDFIAATTDVYRNWKKNPH